MSNATAQKEGLALHYLIREPIAHSLGKKAIILLHGVGSNEQDLFSMAKQLPDDYYIISAQGPITLGTGSYAWYQVDFSSGKPVFNHQQEINSRQTIIKFIDQLQQQYHFSEIYLGGFSQGAIMSYTIGLTHPKEVKGIFSLGGRILDEIKPFVAAPNELKKLKVFVAHGVQDGTLTIQYARDAKEYLQSRVILSYHEYNMGHQISPDVLRDLDNWLK